MYTKIIARLVFICTTGMMITLLIKYVEFLNTQPTTNKAFVATAIMFGIATVYGFTTKKVSQDL